MTGFYKIIHFRAFVTSAALIAKRGFREGEDEGREQ